MTALSTHTDLGLGKSSTLYRMERIDEEDLDGDPRSNGNEFIEGRERPKSVALIDDRTLRRECLRHSLISQRVSWDIAAYGSMKEWRAAAELHPPLAAILFHVGTEKFTNAHVAGEIKNLIEEFSAIPIVILADSDDIIQIVNALDCGVSGYIPSSVSIEVCVEAIKLALAGGVFVPASSVFAMRQTIESGISRTSRLTELFTPRQIKVADAIRQGKPNKIIAYELNMCESTVKVHIRNIMQKLKATNRTEIAYKVRDLFPSETA